ncbi:MAG: PilW family protein [Thermacetogeniaceae bacterium]|jgi:hypothetical protein
MKDEHGFLLAEYTVALALLVIILAVGIIFFFFSSRTYSEGEKKTTVQSNVRLAANYITKEIRHADYISTKAGPAGKTYYCLKLEGGALQKETYKEDGTTSTRTITPEACLEELTFTIENDGEKTFLSFNIKGSAETLRKDYDISSEVLLVNIKDPLNKESSEIIYYTKPNI